jgi:hypothetical protein
MYAKKSAPIKVHIIFLQKPVVQKTTNDCFEIREQEYKG